MVKIENMKKRIVPTVVLVVMASTLSTTIASPYYSQSKVGHQISKTNEISHQEKMWEPLKKETKGSKEPKLIIEKPAKTLDYDMMDKNSKHLDFPLHEDKEMHDMEFKPRMPDLDLAKFIHPKLEEHHEHEHQAHEFQHDDHLSDIIANNHHHEEHHQQHEDSHGDWSPEEPAIHYQHLEKDGPEAHNHEMLEFVLWATIPPYFPKGKLEWFKNYPTVKWIGKPEHCIENSTPSKQPNPPRFQLLPYHFHLATPLKPNDKTTTVLPTTTKTPTKTYVPPIKNIKPTKIFAPTKTVVTTTTTTPSPTKSSEFKQEQHSDAKGGKKSNPIKYQQEPIEPPVQQQEHEPIKIQQKEEPNQTKGQRKEEQSPTKTQQKEPLGTKTQIRLPVKGQQKEAPRPDKVHEKEESHKPTKDSHQKKENLSKQTQQHPVGQSQEVEIHPTKTQQKEAPESQTQEEEGTKTQQKEQHPTQIQQKEEPQIPMAHQKEEDRHQGNQQQMEQNQAPKNSEGPTKGGGKKDFNQAEQKEEMPSKGGQQEVEENEAQNQQKTPAHEEKAPQQEEEPVKGHQEQQPKPTKQPVKVIETNKVSQEEQHHQVQIPNQESESLYSEGNSRQHLGNSDHPFGQRQQVMARMVNPPVNHNVRESFLSAAEQARNLARVVSSSNHQPSDSISSRSSRTNSSPVRSPPDMRLSQSDFNEIRPMERVYLGQGSIERHEANGRTQVRLSCNLGPETGRLSVEWARFVGEYETDLNSGDQFDCPVHTCKVEQVKSDPLVTVHSNMVPQSNSGQGLSQAALTIHQVEDEHQGVYRCSAVRETAAGKRELVYRLIAV